MDKTTKGFVIAAAGVVIASGLVYLFSQYSGWREQQDIRQAQAAAVEEKAQERLRNEQCNIQASKFFGDPEVADRNRFYWRAAWKIDYCMKSSLPVDQLVKDPQITFPFYELFKD